MDEYIAVLVDIREVSTLPAEFMPYVNIKANQEGRELEGSEKVAIFNIATTTSFLSIFLDKGKTIEEVEAEILKDASAKMNRDTRVSVKNALY